MSIGSHRKLVYPKMAVLGHLAKNACYSVLGKGVNNSWIVASLRFSQSEEDLGLDWVVGLRPPRRTVKLEFLVVIVFLVKVGSDSLRPF